MAKITAPNTGFRGESFGVAFTDGVGFTDDTWLIQQFKEKGYEVDETVSLEEPKDVEAFQEVVDRLEDEVETLTLALEDVSKENEALKVELAKVPKEFDRNEAMAYLKEKGVEFAGNISNDNLKKLLRENA